MRLKKCSEESKEKMKEKEPVALNSKGAGDVVNSENFPIIDEQRNASLATETAFNHPDQQIGKVPSSPEPDDESDSGDEAASQEFEYSQILCMVPKKYIKNAKTLFEQLSISPCETDAVCWNIDGVKYTQRELQNLFKIAFSRIKRKVRKETPFFESIIRHRLQDLIVNKQRLAKSVEDKAKMVEKKKKTKRRNWWKL